MSAASAPELAALQLEAPQADPPLAEASLPQRELDASSASRRLPLNRTEIATVFLLYSFFFLLSLSLVELDRIRAFFSGSDADDLLYRNDKNLAVADLSRASGLKDGIDHLRGFLIRHKNLNFDLGQEINRVLRPTIQLGMTFLPSEALHFGDGHPLNANLCERFFDFIKLERFDDRLNLFHGNSFR